MMFYYQIIAKHRLINLFKRMRGVRPLPDILNEKLADDIVAFHLKNRNKK